MKYTLEITNVSKDAKITLQNRSLRSQADIALQENYIQYTDDIFSSRIVLPKKHQLWKKAYSLQTHTWFFSILHQTYSSGLRILSRAECFDLIWLPIQF